jgi:hypothetical protein
VTSDAFYRITGPETATLSLNTAATPKESAQ